MRTGILAQLAVVVGISSAAPVGRAGELTENQQLLLRYCRAMYHGEGVRDLPSAEQAAIRKKIVSEQHAAKRYFNSRSASELERDLAPIRQSLHLGSFAYRSVAYALAYYGVDVLGNARRLLGIDLGARQVPPSSEQSESTVESDWYSIRSIRSLYERHPNDKLWLLAVRAYLRSGSASETPPAELVSAFERYPEAILRAWSHAPASDNGGQDWANTWAAMLEQYGYDPTKADQVEHPKYTRMRALLLKLTKSNDLEVARAARKLRRAFLAMIDRN